MTIKVEFCLSIQKHQDAKKRNVIKHGKKLHSESKKGVKTTE